MGRHLKFPVGHRVVKESALSGRPPDEAVLERLGLNGNTMICQSCNARNPRGADKCRKCGTKAKEFRRKRMDYADE